jgi:hypothetical protein
MKLQTTGSVKAPGIGDLISYRNDGKYSPPIVGKVEIA